MEPVAKRRRFDPPPDLFPQFDNALDVGESKWAEEPQESHNVPCVLPPLPAVRPVDMPDADTRWETSGAFFRLLVREKAEYCCPPKNVVFVCAKDDKVVDIYRGMVEHNFLSVPVLQKTKNKYYGFLDLSDIVRHLVRIFGDETMRGSKAFWSQLKAEQCFQHTKVKKLMTYPLTRRNPFHPVAEGYSLYTVFELLARDKALARVPVISACEDRVFVNLITQSVIIAFLRKHMRLLGKKAFKPLSACPQFFRAVHTIRESEQAIDAFNLMTAKNVGGLAVVDEKNNIVGNLSLRDLKLVSFNVEKYWRFYHSTAKFLKLLDQEYQETDRRPRTVITATKEDTIESVITKLGEHRIHQLYIVEGRDALKPIGLVSLKGILLEILN